MAPTSKLQLQRKRAGKLGGAAKIKAAAARREAAAEEARRETAAAEHFDPPSPALGQSAWRG